MPEPAAELDRHVDRGADLRDGLAVDRSPFDRAVEIDDVQPLRAGLDPAAGGYGGVAVVGVSRSKSPSMRRTQRPPRMSIAG